MRIYILLCLSCGLLLAPATMQGQPVSVGIKGGLFTSGDFAPTSFKQESRSYTIGPMLEVRLPFRVAVEMDVLYKRFGQGYLLCTMNWCASSRVRANVWDVPLLAKYRFRNGWTPFASGGAAYRRVMGSDTIDGTKWSLPPNSPWTYRTVERRGKNVAGIVAGGGVELRLPLVRIAPEIRYTRWSSPTLDAGSKHQAEVLVGIQF